NAGCSRGDGIAAVLEREHRDLKSFALVAEHILFRDAYVLKREVTRVTRADTHLPVQRTARESGHRTLDYKAANAAVVACLLLFKIGPAKEKEMIRRVPERDPHLLAVQDPIVAVTLRVRPHSDNIRTGVRFGQAKGRELFALRLRNKILLLLF